MRRLILDVDGVVADFTGHLLKSVGAPFTAKDVKQWDSFENLCPKIRKYAHALLRDPKWWLGIPLLEVSVEYVSQLDLHFDIFWATSPWLSCEGWETSRRRWLSEHFGVQPNHVVVTNDKSILGGDAIIDDKPENVEGWLRHNSGLGLLFAAPYNEHQTPVGAWRVGWDDAILRLLG